jgi:serine/threonine protein kinase
MKVCPTCNRLYRSGIVLCSRDGSLLNSLREWQPGDSISEKFRIVEKIGHGSLGPAFRAKVLPFGGIRALKCLTARLADDDRLMERFQQEILTASALRHLNAAHIESLERSSDGRPFIVMEYVPGLSLRELLIRGGCMRALDVVDIMTQVCAVLDCAHWHRMVHRNLTPDNLIIAEEHDGAPRVKVMEFGIANLREAAAEHGKEVGDVVTTEHGTVVGSAEYISPEQTAGTPRNALDGRSDLYSVGVMMYEALTGDLPSAGNNPIGLLYQKQEIAVSELLCGTVLKALQRDPDYRFQSATEMIAALREVSHSLGKPSSVEVDPAIAEEPARVSLSAETSHPIIEVAQDSPLTSPGRKNAQPRSHRYPGRPSQYPAKRRIDLAAASADRNIEQIRKAWAQTAGQVPARGVLQGNRARTSLLVVVCASTFLLVSWVVYRGPALLAKMRERTAQSGGTSAPQHAPARDAASDLESHEVHTSAVEPQPESPEPATPQQAYGPHLPAPSAEENAVHIPASRGWQSSRQKAESTTAVRSGERESATLTPQAASPEESKAASSPQAQINERIAMGWLLVERKDYPGAIESFTAALRMDPSNVEAQAALRLARFANQHPKVDILPSDSSADKERDERGQQ